MINPIHKLINCNKIFVEAHIADIHFGAIDPKKQYDILVEQFVARIALMKNLDIVSINGDLFDHKFMANSDVVLYATMFVQNLVDICRSKGSTLLIIAGTNLHDSGQLKMFYHYMGDKSVDVRIIEQVRFEYIKGKKVLIIPELYGMGEEYYAKFLYRSGLYDAVYMHGTFKGAIYGKDEEDLNSNREPVFSINNFNKCKGPIISGHNHVPGCYSSHFYYCGSPYRWKFGEEEDKGFIILMHNTESREYYIHFEPIQSFRYDTVNLDNLVNADPKEVIAYVQQLQAKGIDNIRIEFTIENEENLNIIKAYYKNSHTIKVHADFKKEKIMKATEDLSDKYKDYDFIFDKSLKPEEIITRYINHEKGFKYVTTEDFIEFMKVV